MKISVLGAAAALMLFSFASPALAVSSPTNPAASTAPSTCDSTKDSYCLLAPLPLSNPSGNIDNKIAPADYIKGIINLAVAIAGVVAVMQIIFGGFTYITSDGFGKKSDAKDRIEKAVIGLILTIGAFTILKTINPTLVVLNLTIPNVGSDATVSDPGSCLGEKDPSTGQCITAIGSGVKGEGSAWQQDDFARKTFESIPGVSINHPNCEKVGDQGCTSVAGLGHDPIVSTIKTLADKCKCQIIITGGSEFWMHGGDLPPDEKMDINKNPTPHKPSGSVLDLSLLRAPDMDAFLRSKGKKFSGDGPSCAPGDEKIVYEHSLFVNEKIDGNDPHWHVCFGGY